MTVLAPFDRHPADPAGVTAHGQILADRASQAVTTHAPRTRRAYQSVLTHWDGMGRPEAEHSVQRVTSEVDEVSEQVAAAAVALAYWGRCVRDFNTEVDAILATVARAGAGQPDLTDDELAALRAQARRVGQERWHRAYDTHIVTGRQQVARILAEGPEPSLILELFQAGQLSMSIITLYPRLDLSRVDWQRLFRNLRAHGIDPQAWLAAGTYDPEVLRQRLDLLREAGVPPIDYADLLQRYWVAVAADKAGIDLSQWDPRRGAGELSDIIQAVYTYYGQLYLDHPHLQWAGMANMIGPSFAAGFFDLDLFRRIARDLAGNPAVPVDMRFLAHASDAELKFFETTFLQMQKDIFFDQAMVHEAYLGGGLDAIRELEQAGLIDYGTSQAWRDIDHGWRTGDPSLVERGNTRLLLREQRDIIDLNYQRMYQRPGTGPAFTYLMTAVGAPSIPGAQSFADYRPVVVTVETPGPERIFGWDNPLQGEVDIRTPFPAGNIADFDDRWTFITEDTLPAYQQLLREDPARARAIIASDVGDRIDDFRLHHRIDELLGHYLGDWGIEDVRQ